MEDAEQELGERTLGEHPVVFRVANHTDRPGEVVGCASGCNALCCLEAEERGRVPVPPGQAAELVSKLNVRRAGPFEFEGKLYLNDGGHLRTVPLRVAGVGVAPKEKPHAPAP